MSPQQKTTGGGGGRNKANNNSGSSNNNKGSSKQKDGGVVTEQSNNQQISASNIKKSNIANSNVNNNNNIEQVKTEKEKPHVKPTAEQIRIAQITEIKGGNQDPTREKVIQLMEATERSEEDACLALYECDNDLDRAVMYLLENLEIGALITTTKKKKSKAAADGDGEDGEFTSNNNNNHHHHHHRDGSSRDGGPNERSKGARSSNRGGASNRGRSRPSGGDSSRSNNNNNINEEGQTGPGLGRPPRMQGERRGGGGGLGNMGGDPNSGIRRGGFAGRGRGGRMGPRGGRDPNRINNNYRNNNQEHQQEIDNWDPTATQMDSNNKGDDSWGDCGDWDNEEYTGSLSDTKVFTPSTQQDLAAPPGLEQQILNQQANDVSQYNAAGAPSSQYPELHPSTAAQQLRQALEMPSLGPQQSAQLSAEQSQYFNTLGTQNNTAAYQSSVQYQYSDQVVSNQQAPRSHQQPQQQQQQQQQQRPRARVPPPSKIPSSAVEMPSDVDLPAYLDVQFGGLDFGTGTEDTYETEKYSQGIDQSAVDDYAGNKSTVVSKNAQAALAGLQPSQLIQNADSISSSTQADLSTNYAQLNTSSMGTTGQTTLDQLTKAGADLYASAGNTYQNLSYQSTQKGGGYQSSYGTNAYNSSQSTNNYPASSNAYGGYNQNSYQQSQGTQVGNTVQQQTGSSGTVSNSSNANQQNTTGYMSNQYSGNQSSFQTSQQSSYPSQSVYGNSNNTDRFSGSINSLTSKLKGTQGAYDSSNNANVSSGTSSASSNNAITTSSINSTLGLNNSAKTTTSTSSMKSGASQVSSGTSATTNTSAGVGGTSSSTGNGASSNIVQNIPLVSSYIQPAAFYQQQPYLHFEDMQLVQPRMTPMTGYYEYQTPTSLTGVRSDGTTSNLAYPTMSTMSADGRFTRTDNNSSPVQSAQTGSSQQLMNLPPYAYFYGTNVMPGGIQQFPQFYSQMPATNPNAGQFAKQSAYSGGYGSTGYDTLNQTADYNKSTYQSTGQQTKGHSSANQTGTNSADISSAMYNKSHVTLNKVNSYDKQSFHSGTPPPFNLGSQAGSQTQYQQHLYLQPMAPHHNINMHQPIHQMEGGRITNSRRDANSSGQRQQSGNQSKSGSKPGYSSTYWNTQN